MSGLYSIGDILLGTLAVALPHYRVLLIALYAPALPIIIYALIIPESPRWLHAAGHYDTVLNALHKQAARNDRVLSGDSIAYLSRPVASDKPTSIVALLQNGKLLVRVVLCSMLWALVVFMYYGISVKSTKFADDDDKVREFRFCV